MQLVTGIHGIKRAMPKKYWLMKSDQEDYPLEKFFQDRVTPWEGVRNYQARNFMMNEMQVGDEGIFYVSNAEPSAAKALLKIVSSPKVDTLAFNKKSEYYDAGSTPEKPRWFCVDVEYVGTLSRAVSLEEMRRSTKLKDMRLLQRGNRLSILPLSEDEYFEIIRLGNCL